MNFTEAVQSALAKYAEFTGRARRSEYWWFFLFNVGVTTVLSYVNQTLYIVAVLALLLPGIAVGVRRLHDTGRSGWFLFIALIPIVGVIILIVFLATDGDADANEYGPPPGEAPISDF